MACAYYGIEEDAVLYGAYGSAMQAFGYIYYAECVLKLVGLGRRQYFADGWCRFDFFLVCMSLVDQLAPALVASILPVPPFLLRVLRILRIVRILRLLKGAREVRNLPVTLILSFPSLVNVGSLLALCIFIYSVLGMQLFAFLAHGFELRLFGRADTLSINLGETRQCAHNVVPITLAASARVAIEVDGAQLAQSFQHSQRVLQLCDAIVVQAQGLQGAELAEISERCKPVVRQE